MSKIWDVFDELDLPFYSLVLKISFGIFVIAVLYAFS